MQYTPETISAITQTVYALVIGYGMGLGFMAIVALASRK